jgi:hypothetical protein
VEEEELQLGSDSESSQVGDRSKENKPNLGNSGKRKIGEVEGYKEDTESFQAKLLKKGELF